jgi:hypothetical protein
MSLRLASSAVLIPVLLITVAAAPVAAQDEERDSFERALVDLLREQGLVDEARAERLLELAHQRAERDSSEIDLMESSLRRLRAPDVQAHGGTPGKLEFRSADGTWSLGLRGRIVARFESVDADNAAQSGDNFSVPRARLTLEGKAGAENVQYKLEIDAPTNSNPDNPAENKSASVRNAWVDWRFPWDDELRFGQFLFPFGRERTPAGGTQSLPSTSIASTEFVPGFEPGAMLHGDLGTDVLNYYIAVSNGEGRGKNNTPGDNTNGLRHGARVVWSPLGRLHQEGPAFQTVENRGTKVALGTSWMENDDSADQHTPAPGAETATKGAEFQLFTGPVSVLAEYFDRDSDRAFGPSVADSGDTVQVGCFLGSAVWEAVVRRSRIDFDVEDSQREHTYGLNYYVDRHNGKWQLELDRQNQGGFAPHVKRIRLQYQVIF